MELRDIINPKQGQTYHKKNHRHPRPAFKNLSYRKKDCEDIDVKVTKEFFSIKRNDLFVYKLKSNTDLKISYKETIVGRLHLSFIDLYHVINNSKRILEHEDNWDNDGSKKYELQTWIKTVKFLIKFYNWRDEKHLNLVKPPKIFEGPEGSFDLYWKNSRFTYLINIPEENENASYFYKTINGTKVEAEFDLELFNPAEIQHFFDSEFI